MNAMRTALLAACVCGLFGCEPVKRADRVAITTRVTLPNGQPARDVLMCFLPHTALQMPAEFPLDGNGQATRNANGIEPTLHPGKFTVYFQPIEPRSGDRARFAAAFKLIPARYTQQGNTGLEVEVGASNSEIAFQLQP